MNKVVKGLVAVVVLLAVVAGGWVLLHKSRSSRAPNLLWTEADVAKPPPDAENGWSVLNAKADKLPREMPEKDLKDLTVQPDEKSVAAKSAQLVTALEGAKDSLAIYDEALAKPRFVDGCPLDVTANCPFIPTLRAHELGVFRALSASADGKHVEAFRFVQPIVKADLDYLTHSRTLLGTMIGATMLKSSLKTASYVLDAAAKTPGSLASEKTSLEELARSLENATELVTIERAIVSEYVFMTKALQSVNQPGGLPTGDGFALKYLFDPAATIDEVNPHFQALLAHAKNPASDPPEAKSFVEGAGFFTYNPGGKHILEMMFVSIGPRIREFQKSKDEIKADAAALSGKLKVAAAAPAAEAQPAVP